jgi:hypothetical protein
MWFTIATPERYHLKKIVLRMYWDGDTIPAVEAPIGDFFGLGLGEYFMYESGPALSRFAEGAQLFLPDAVSPTVRASR